MNKKIAFLAIVLWLIAVTVGVLLPKPLITQDGELVALGVTHFTGMDITSDSTDAMIVNQTGVGDIAEFQDAGTVILRIADGGLMSGGTGGQTWTLAAAAKLLIDGDTTNQTQTTGTLDINFGSVTTDTMPINVSATMDNGMVAGADMYLGQLTMIGNDANGDWKGLTIIADATANAGAGTYEYGVSVDCEENTAGACLDGVLITSSGIDTGLTDGVDVSASNIANAINIGSNLIAGGNSDTLTIGATDATVILDRNDSGSLTYTGTDNDANADVIYDAGGTGAVTIGSADVTNVTINSDVGLTFAGNSESIFDGTDGAFDFTRNTTGTVTLTSSDNDATADMTIDPGGAAALVLGSADVTSVSVIADADLQMRNGATGNVDISLHDYADSADDDMAHVVIRGNCTDAGTGAEDCDYSVLVVEAGAAAETRFTIDADGGITIGSANNAAVTSLGTTTDLQNAATGNVELAFQDYVDSADDDMDHVVLVANCTDATSAAEDCDLNIQVVEAGAAPETRIAIDADGDITLGSANNAGITLLGTGVSVRNSATGNVTVDYRDYADSADDDMAHAIVTVNCTDAGTGAEDCDYTIGVVEAGAAAETRFNINADGGIEIGSANNDSISLTTDGTGDGELTVPNESISAAEILNLTRSIPLPLGSWVPCAGTVAGVWDAAGADTEPDLAAVNTALVIEYDDTGGELDIDEICNSFTVPADYASGGTFVFRVTQGGATATLESIECRISVDGAAIGAADEDNLANQTAVQSVTSTPTGTWAAGASIGVACKQGNAAPDDVVNFHAIEGQYTATQ